MSTAVEQIKLQNKEDGETFSSTSSENTSDKTGIPSGEAGTELGKDSMKTVVEKDTVDANSNTKKR